MRREHRIRIGTALGAAAALAAIAFGMGCERPRAADLVMFGGTIATMDEAAPRASALAARDGRIVAVGTDADVRALIGPDTEVVDLDGRFACPGFIESHGHLNGLGRSLMNIDLRDAPTWDAVVERIARAAAERPAGEWILGWGWHQDKWERPPSPAVEGYPTHELLSRAVPDHPVLLKHAAGSHAGMVNAAAMRLAGIDASTPDPDGGRILRDRRGRPTGVLRERAYALALDAQQRAENDAPAAAREARMREEIARAQSECLSKGVTTIHDAGASFEIVDLLRRMADEDELQLRVWVMLNEDNDALAERLAAERTTGGENPRVTVRAIKRSLDGALGSHGAWLIAPYDDLPGSHGHNTLPLDDLERTAELAAEHDVQLCVHAIGDRANRETLDLFERVWAARGGRTDHRWRIEHAQHLHPDDIPRFAELGVVASVQGVHCTSDGPWVPQRIGERRASEGAYMWRALLDSGALVVNGTDAPIEDVDPLANFRSSVTRLMPNGEAFHPAQRMTREEALRAATIDAARAGFEEASKGSLAPGKLADVVVISHDLLAAPDDALAAARVELTIVGGRIVHRPGGEAHADGRM